MRNSTSPTSCLPLLLKYMLNPSSSFPFSFALFVMASNGEKLWQEKPAAGELIDPPHLLWTVYAYGLNGFAWECVVPRNPNIMGDPFPPNTWAMSLSPPLFFLLSLFFLVTSLSFFELQPTIQEHEELVWLARNLKLEVTNYSRILYGPRGAAYPSGGDDDDDGGGDEEDSEVTLNYQPTKRRHHCLLAVNTYRHTTHIFLFCCFYLFIFSFSKHLNLV